jgi:hypothetical protein
VAASLAYVATEGILGSAGVVAGRHQSLAVAVAVDVIGALLLLTAALATGSLSPDREAHP